MPTTLESQERTIDNIMASSEVNVINSEIQITNELTDSLTVTEYQLPPITVNEKALMIENMILTDPEEPRRKKIVPNHLLDTKIYTKLHQNAYVQAKPAEILFEGFEVGKKQSMQLILLNSSPDVLKLHIIPPQTANFSIIYKKPERMVSGTVIKCFVDFNPDEWRYYYDSVRIHCPGEENLIIPIHAYPVMNTKEFPRNYTFPPTPVGASISKSFPLKSFSPLDFEYCFKYIQRSPAFQIEPESGVVPANSEVEVTVTFSPLEFQTSIMKVELVVSQFNFKGLISTFVGTSQPGLLRKKNLSNLAPDVLDPKNVSPIERARSFRKSKVKSAAPNTMTTKTSKMVLEKNGIVFPSALDSPSAVAKVLIQKAGKLKVNEIRKNLQQQKEGLLATYQMKEAVFDQLVRLNVYEERQNQLRWQVKLGDKPMALEEKFSILGERSAANLDYKHRVQGIPIEEEEYSRSVTACSNHKLVQDVDFLPEQCATFDSYSNDPWVSRHAALDRFVQAARQVIIRNRCNKRIRGLRRLKKSISGVVRVEGEDSDSTVENNSNKGSLDFKFNRIKKFTFSTYTSPNIKDDMAPDALGVIPVPTTNVVVKRDIPFFNLKVPLYYQLYGYQPHSVHEAASGYVPSKNVRKLRTGAEDEEIRLPVEDSDPCQVFVKPPEDVRIQGRALDQNKNVVTALTPPQSLFKPMEYPSLHIMNPAPGLQVFHPQLHYSEVDFDFHLCPLPRYPRTDRTVTQKKLLDRDDTIRGIMTWKKFPSSGLASLTNSMTLSSMWVPRWDQCFSKELMPSKLPPLMTQLEADDAENCVDENENSEIKPAAAVTLTPAMIEAQFVLIDSIGDNSKEPAEERPTTPYNKKTPNIGESNRPVTREKCEEDLNMYLLEKFNKLSSQINSKIDSLNGLYTDDRFVLK